MTKVVCSCPLHLLLCVSSQSHGGGGDADCAQQRETETLLQILFCLFSDDVSVVVNHSCHHVRHFEGLKKEAENTHVLILNHTCTQQQLEISFLFLHQLKSHFQ